MSGASCVHKVEHALRGVDGVLSASVNLAMERATVEAVATTPVADLRRAVREAGYEPLEVVGEAVHDDEREARRREIAALRRKLIAGAVLSLPLLWGSLAHLGVRAIWSPGIVMNWYVQLALATPAPFWLGRHFCRGSWTCRWVTSSSCGPVKRSRWTGSSRRASRPSTSPCSPGSRCRWTKDRGTPSSARPSTRPGRFRCGRPGWGVTPCWPRSSGWCRTRRARRPRSSGWPIAWRVILCRQ